MPGVRAQRLRPPGLGPNGPATNNTLDSVTAPGTGDVWAGGLGLDSGVFASTLTEHWNGTSWTVVASPNVAGAFGTEVLGISGRAGGPLFAVGDVHEQSGQYHTFGMRGQ